MRKTTSNIIYNSLYQVLILIVPLLTIPYVSRVLGTDGVGINALVTSVANFLGTIIIMGMYQLGAREIAKSDKSTIRCKFFSLWRIQVSSGIIIVILYILSIFIFFSKNKLYYLLEIPFLISYVLDISWFFVGIGEVKKVILRNTLIKLLSLGLIFLLVKSKSDLWVYVFILSGSNFVANVVFLFNLRDRLPKGQGTYRSYTYLKMSIALLLPQIALQLYTNFDDIIVGGISGSSQLAYYDQSQKIARIIVAILTSASTIMMPKMASLEHQRDLKNMFRKSLDYTFVCSLFLCCLVMVNSKNFVLWYYGTSFKAMANNMLWVSLIIVFISYGGVFSNQYMLAQGQYFKFSISYYIGGALNVGLNLLLVSKYKADGGTISLIFTELFICLSRLFLTRKELDIKSIIRAQFKYILVFICTLLINLLFPVVIHGKYFISLILQTIISSGVFVGLLIVFKTKIIKDLRGLKR